MVDGSQQLRLAEWTKTGTMQSLIQILTQRISEIAIPGNEFSVILDTYTEPTTKYSEHRRRNNIAPSPDMVVELQTPVPKEKLPFLSNSRNKQSLIDLCASDLFENNINVELAEDGDADTLIAKRALDIAQKGINVKVIANDTDILIMLIHHFDFEKHADIFYVGSCVLSIRLLYSAIGKSI